MAIVIAKNGIRLESWQTWGLIVFLALAVLFLIIVLVLDIYERKQGEKKNDIRGMDTLQKKSRGPDA